MCTDGRPHASIFPLLLLNVLRKGPREARVQRLPRLDQELHDDDAFQAPLLLHAY